MASFFIHLIKKYSLFLIPLFGVAIVLPEQFFHIGSVTFNFADNWGYLTKIQQMRDFFFAWTWYIPMIVAPLSSWFCMGVGIWIHDVMLINLIILGSIIWAWIGAYHLFLRIGWYSSTAILGATVFAFNSLTLYANWFNLVGYMWIPFFVSALFFETRLWKIYLFGCLLALSGHYFLLLFIVIVLVYYAWFFGIERRWSMRWLMLHSVFLIGSLSVIWITYGVPLFLRDLGGSLVQFSAENRISIIPLDMLELIRPNNQNFITNTYLWIFWNDPWVPRYSAYFWIITLLLSIWGLFSPRKPLRWFFLLLFFFSLILFLGWSLQVGWYSILPFLPFQIIDWFWLSWIFRKSVYFFYLIAFSLWGLIALSGVFRTQKIIIVLLLSLGIMLENTVSFSRPVHTYEPLVRSAIPWTGTVLALPNTGYSVSKFRFLFHEIGRKVFEYPDVTIPGGENFAEDHGLDCFSRSLIFPDSRTHRECQWTNILPNRKFWETNMIDTIVLFKKWYTEYFFYEAKTLGPAYTNLLWKIRHFGDLFTKVYEDEMVIVYSVHREKMY